MRSVSVKSKKIKTLLNDVALLRPFHFLTVPITTRLLRIVQNDLIPEKKKLCLL